MFVVCWASAPQPPHQSVVCHLGCMHGCQLCVAQGVLRRPAIQGPLAMRMTTLSIDHGTNMHQGQACVGIQPAMGELQALLGHAVAEQSMVWHTPVLTPPSAYAHAHIFITFCMSACRHRLGVSTPQSAGPTHLMRPAMGQGAPPSASQMAQASWANLFTAPSKPYSTAAMSPTCSSRATSRKGAADHETAPTSAL